MLWKDLKVLIAKEYWFTPSSISNIFQLQDNFELLTKYKIFSHFFPTTREFKLVWENDVANEFDEIPFIGFMWSRIGSLGQLDLPLG